MARLSDDLIDPHWMYLKGALFLAIGVSSVALILIEHPQLKLGSLLVLAIWSFARCYYFAFYVIEKYVDPTYKFSGLWSAAAYLLGSQKKNSSAKRPN
jgi:hypothetical protein